MFRCLRKFIMLKVLFVAHVQCLDNGVALTPPMGWMSWERFRCNIDCYKHPDDCLSEKLFMDMADRLANDGYRDAGYVYLVIDDCWSSRYRTADGNLQEDPERFPNGMKFLADYVHRKGLKFGIYTNYGHSTCMGFPGTDDDHLELDAKRFASWDVDYVKMDGCHTTADEQQEGYPKFGKYLNQTNRPIVYSCSWPYYDLHNNRREPNFTLLRQHCNVWRNFHDIRDSWYMIELVANFFGDHQEVFASYSGPGHWNDPDMLMIGNFRLTQYQAEVHMALWAILAAPLLMSNDLRSISTAAKELLQNREVIAINQDPLGIQGKRQYWEDGVSVWLRPISPVDKGHHSYAIAVVNHEPKSTARVKIALSQLGLNYTDGYHVRNIFGKQSLGTFSTSDQVDVNVEPTGVVLLKLVLAKFAG